MNVRGAHTARPVRLRHPDREAPNDRVTLAGLAGPFFPKPEALSQARNVGAQSESATDVPHEGARDPSRIRRPPIHVQLHWHNSLTASWDSHIALSF